MVVFVGVAGADAGRKRVMTELSHWHRLLFRAIEGAYNNARAAHPKWEADPRLARSVAKRAAGTLTAITRQALASVPPKSETTDVASSRASGERTAPSPTRIRASDLWFARAEWRRVRKTLHDLASDATRKGDMPRALALREAASLCDAAFNRLWSPNDISK